MKNKVLLVICSFVITIMVTAQEDVFKVALADGNGNLVTTKIYENIQPLGHGFFKVEYNYKFGLLKAVCDNEGNFKCTEVFPCKYRYISPFIDGLSIIQNDKDLFGVIDTMLQTVVPFSFVNISSYYKGTFIVTEAVNDNRRIGGTYLMDVSGNKITEPVNTYMRPLDENPELLITGGYTTAVSQLINRKGEILLSYEGREILNAGSGVLALADRAEIYKYALMGAMPPPQLIHYDIIDFEGNVLYKDYPSYLKGFKFENGLMVLSKKNDDFFTARYGNIGAINTHGEEIIPCIYDYVTVKQDGFVYVEKDNKFGVLDMSGNEIIPIIYDKIENFGDGLFPVKKGDKCGYLNTKGEIAIPFEFEFADKFTNGFARVKKGFHLGVINTKGEIVIPTIYNSMWEIENGFVMAKKGSDWGVLDVTGKERIPFEYDVIYPFIHNNEKNWFKVSRYGDNYGVMDSDNNTLLPLKFKNVWSYTDGLFIVRLH